MIYMRHTQLGLLCLLPLLLVACASVPEKLEILDTTLTNYEKAMIWGEYNYILAVHKGQPISPSLREHLKSIKVTSYDVIRSRLMPGGNKLLQLVGMKYYNQSYGIVRSVRVEQEWVYDEATNAWVLLTPFPDFK